MPTPEQCRQFADKVDELRRLHVLCSRPWNRFDRARIEKLEAEVDELVQLYRTPDVAAIAGTSSPATT